MRKNNSSENLTELMNLLADKALEISKSEKIVDVQNIGGKTVVPVYKLDIGFAGGKGNIGKGVEPAGAGVKVTKTPVAMLMCENGKVKLEKLSGPPPKLSLLEKAVPFVIEKIKSKKK